MVNLVGFYYTNVSRCTVLRMSNSQSSYLRYLSTYDILIVPDQSLFFEVGKSVHHHTIQIN